MERGLKERVYFVKTGNGFAPPFKPSRGTFRETLSKQLEQLRNMITTTYPMTREQFLGCYGGRQLAVYTKACESLETTPYRAKDAWLRTFVKVEKYNFTKKKSPVPRIIQPRSPRYIVEAGRYVRPIEGKIYKVIDTMFDSTKTLKTVCKGMNAEQRGGVIEEHWKRFVDPVAVGIDASRFDQHVSPDALSFEHEVYKMAYPRDTFFHTLMKHQVRNRGTGYLPEGKIKYSVYGNRMSGDPNTSLGNVLLMCMMMHGYRDTLPFDLSFVNDGDDGVIFLEKKHLKKLRSTIGPYFARLGFDLTVEDPAFSLEEIEFCQCHPVYDGSSYIMVRDPRVAIAKDSVCVKPLDTLRLAQRWAAAVGEGGLALTGGVPVWQAFYMALKRFSKGAKPLTDPSLRGGGLQRLGRGLDRRPVTPTPEARASFWRAFGLTATAQEALEAEYRQYNPVCASEDVRFLPHVLDTGFPRTM